MAKKEATLLVKIVDAGSDALGKIKDGIVGVSKAFLAAGAAAIAFGYKGIEAAREQELSIQKLNQALVNQGSYSSAASKDMQAFAAQLQSVSTFGDETIISMLAMAKSFGVSNDEAKKLVSAAADLSAATGMSLESAVKNLGKTMGGLTGELGESVPALRALTAEQLKSGAAIDLVAQQFAGSKEAIAGNLGILDQLKNSMGDFMELVGKAIGPIVTLFAGKLKNMSDEAQKSTTVFEGLQFVADTIARVFLYLKSGTEQLGGAIGVGLAGAISAVQQVMNGQFTAAKETVKAGLEEIKQIHVDSVTNLNASLTELDQAQAQAREAERQQELNLINQNEVAKRAIKQKAAATAITDDQRLRAQLLDIEIKAGMTSAQLQEEIDKKSIAARRSTLGTIAGLQNSNNATLKTIGKAAALTQIAIDTPVAVGRALAAFPPPFNFIAAGAVGAAMAAQAAQVVGLANGGIVPATAGGVPAVIGEGGRSEAVIPLPDNFESGGFGGGLTVNFNGPIMGDERQARELAVALDRQLLTLRRNNESVAFDSGVV